MALLFRRWVLSGVSGDYLFPCIHPSMHVMESLGVRVDYQSSIIQPFHLSVYKSVDTSHVSLCVIGPSLVEKKASNSIQKPICFFFFFNAIILGGCHLHLTSEVISRLVP